VSLGLQHSILPRKSIKIVQRVALCLPGRVTPGLSQKAHPEDSRLPGMGCGNRQTNGRERRPG
jgi:hypothetical protein